MFGDLFQISVLIKGANLLSGPVRQAMKDLKDLRALADRGRELQELGTRYTVAGALAMGASRQLVGALAAPISAFMELEDAETRARIAYMTSGGTDALFPKIAAEARELGNLLPGTNADFFRMAAALKELGIASNVIADGGLRATAYLRALLGDVGPEQAAEFTATFSRSLGVAEDDFVEFVDVIQRAKFGFGLDPADFAYTLRYVGSLLQDFDVRGLAGGRQLVLLAGALKGAGIEGSKAGTALRGILLELPGLEERIAGSRDLRRLLSGVGEDLTFFRDGEFLGVENFVAQIEKLAVLSKEDRLAALKEIFSVETATALSALARTGVAGLRDAAIKLDRQADMDARLVEVMGTLTNLWEAAAGTFRNALAAFGAPLAPELKALTRLFNLVSTGIQGFAEAHPTLAKVAGLTALVAGGLFAVSAAFLTVYGSFLIVKGMTLVGLAQIARTFVTIFGGLRLGAVALASGLRAVLAPLLGLVVANPIVAGVIALLVGGAFLVWKYWEPIKGFFSGLWTTITEESAAAWRAVTEPLESARTWFSDVFADIAEAIRDPLGLLGRFGGMMDSLASSIFGGADEPVAALRRTTQDMRDLLPSSPAKRGPLSDIGDLRFMETIAAAIRPEPLTARLREVLGFAFNEDRAPLAQRLAFAGAAGGGFAPVTIQVHYAPAYHLPGPADPRSLAQLKAQTEEDAYRLARRIDEVRRRRERGDFS